MLTTVHDDTGGKSAAGAVEAFYDRLLGDREVLRHVDRRYLLRTRARQRAFVSTAGAGRLMHPSNVPLAVAVAVFDSVLSHLDAMLHEADVAPATAAGLVAFLRPLPVPQVPLAVVG